MKMHYVVLLLLWMTSVFSHNSHM